MNPIPWRIRLRNFAVFAAISVVFFYLNIAHHVGHRVHLWAVLGGISSGLAIASLLPWSGWETYREGLRMAFRGRKR
jgi:hypothetical protein